MELINKTEERKTFDTQYLRVLTIKHYLSENREDTYSEEEVEVKSNTELMVLLGKITQFNEEEKKKSKQPGFDLNYIFMKKLIK